ncbi:transposon ty3-I gag-pol polyprotein [Tanacetum coccineum]
MLAILGGSNGSFAMQSKWDIINQLPFAKAIFAATDTQTMWEELLPQAEFAYNRAPSKTTGLSPFMVVYGMNPHSPLDLAVIDTTTKFSKEASDLAADIKHLHEQVHAKITKNNELLKYRRDKNRKHILFQPGDLVWINLRKERFPSKRRSKLSPRSEGPFRILAKVNDNAYKVDLPGEYNVSATFNVADLQPYYDPEEPLPSLRTNSSDEGEDVSHTNKEPEGTKHPDPTQIGLKWVSLAQAESNT